MSWKIATQIFIVILIFALIVYWFLPLETIEYSGFNTGPKNTNFSLDNLSKMQFYDRLRYQESDISYKIEGCDLKKTDDIERAFEIVEDLTVLNFYPVSSNEEIYATCENSRKFDGDFFIAGEGGPINITKTSNFNVISKGAITLITDSRCEEPNVAIHELLHALGFDHSNNPRNIMYNFSDCDQEIGEDIPKMINWLYSFPAQPDLSVEEAQASMYSRYINVEFTIKNNGLIESNEAKIKVYADNKTVYETNLEKIEVGAGRIIKVNNILVLQKNVEEIRISVDYQGAELNKENNEITLKIKNN